MNFILLIPFLLFILFLPPFRAHAAPLVGDLSNYRIDITSNFNGTRIFLFGARNDTGDIVVAVRGPQRNYMVRKKESVGGIWINRDRMKFWNLPDFYALAASKPLGEIGQTALFGTLGLGEDNLFAPPADPKAVLRYGQFVDAFLRYQHTRGLYMEQPEPVAFMGETLFKTVVDFPDNIPPGNYTAEIYLVSDGEITGMQSTPITVVKSGLDAFLAMYAHEYPALYGITAIVLALAAGWFAGRIFERI